MGVGLLGSGDRARAVARGGGEAPLATAARAGGGAGAGGAAAGEVPGEQMEVAMALMGWAPAYLALVAQAQVDAAGERGMDPDTAARLVVETMDGTAALLRARDHDAGAVRREVASPGGYTERGLHALEEAGVPEALHTAMDVVTTPRRA